MRRMTCGLAAACFVAAAARVALAQDEPDHVEPKRLDATWLVHRFDLGTAAFHVPGIDVRRESDCGTWDRCEVGYGCITSVAVSADGRRLVAVGGTHGNTVVAFDAATGRAERSWGLAGSLPPDERPRGESGAGCIAAIGKGTVIVLGWKHDGEVPPGHNATVVHVLRDDDPPPVDGIARTTAVAELPGVPLSVVAADGDPGACWIVTTEAIFRGTTSDAVPRFENLHAEPCTRGIAFARGALIRLPDRGYTLVNQEGAQVVAHLSAGAGTLLAMTPDGRWYADYDEGIVVGEVALRGRRVARHFETRQPRPRFIRPEPWSCVLSPDGAAVAWVTHIEPSEREDERWTTDVFSVPTGESLATIPALPLAPGGLAFSADGTVLFLTDRTVVRRFDLRSGREILPATGHLQPPHLVRVSVDGKLIVSASEDRICAWSTDDGQAVSTVAVPPMLDVVDVAVRPDPAGPQIVAVLGHVRRYPLVSSPEIVRWRAADGGEVDREPLTNLGSPAIALSEDGFHLAVCARGGVFVRDPARGSSIHAIVEQPGAWSSVGGIATNADGTVVVVEDEASVYALRISAKKVTKTVLEGARILQSLALSSDGRTFAAKSSNEPIRRWDLDGSAASPTVLGPELRWGPTVCGVGHGRHVFATIRDRLFVAGSDALEPPVLRERSLRAPVTCASSLDHPDAFVTGLGDGTLAVWRIDWSAKATLPK